MDYNMGPRFVIMSASMANRRVQSHHGRTGKGMGLHLVMMFPAAPLPDYHLGITVRNMDHHFIIFVTSYTE
jgi:hypothetical protein